MQKDKDLVGLLVGLNATLFCVEDFKLKVITIPYITEPDHVKMPALLSGAFNQDSNLTLEKEMRAIIFGLTAMAPDYIEQLYTFADKGRDPRERIYKNRVVSIAYMGVVKSITLDAHEYMWEEVYEFLPWEDRGYPEVEMFKLIDDFLSQWVAQDKDLSKRLEKKNRIDLSFGRGKSNWDAYRVLDRYELLYESKFLQEYFHDQGKKIKDEQRFLGRSMAFDHRRILATSLARVRGKLRYRPLAFDFLPKEFTLLELKQVVEVISGNLLHKQNFRRLVENSKLVEGIGKKVSSQSGRPAELFRFRKAVLMEKRAPGVGGIKSLR